jgi:hypothetical protein
MALSGGLCVQQIFLIWAGWSILAGNSVVWAGRSILAGSYIFYLGGFGPFWRVQSYVIHCTSEFNVNRQTDRQTTFKVYRVVDVELRSERRGDRQDRHVDL